VLLAVPVVIAAALVTVVAWRSVRRSANRAGSTLVVDDPHSLPDRAAVPYGRTNVVLFRDGARIAAISSVCTHLGCVLAMRERGFECPCHGSRFDPLGRRLTGPATGDLPWYQIDLLADGRAIVRVDRRVALGTFTALS
jgi:cytochrome b6-f complex iron-sulfur subunit